MCFLRIKFCLSVGVFCERLRANTVRPYRVLGKYFVISLLILHAVLSVLFQKHTHENKLIEAYVILNPYSRQLYRTIR